MRDINYVRESLMDAMDKLMEGKINIEQAKAMANLGQVLVESAKVEVTMMIREDFNGTGFLRNINPKLGYKE